MNKVRAVFGKELKELLKNRTTILICLVFAGFFAIVYSQQIVNARDSSISVDGTIFYLSLSIALFTAYIATGQIFMMEKRDGVIETLMCAPVTLRQIWLGKTLAGVVPSWLTAVFAALLLVSITGIQTGNVLIPEIPTLFHVIITVPVFVAAFTGLLGFGQLLLGMRENRLLNFVLFAPAFAVLYGSGMIISRGISISWIHTGIVFCGSLLLLILAIFLTGYLSRERIVTTIA
jgi:ABC-2 type transport system permease protein